MNLATRSWKEKQKPRRFQAQAFQRELLKTRARGNLKRKGNIEGGTYLQPRKWGQWPVWSLGAPPGTHLVTYLWPLNFSIKLSQ